MRRTHLPKRSEKLVPRPVGARVESSASSSNDTRISVSRARRLKALLERRHKNATSVRLKNYRRNVAPTA